VRPTEIDGEITPTVDTGLWSPDDACHPGEARKAVMKIARGNLLDAVYVGLVFIAIWSVTLLNLWSD
jgi:hypothetical protein